MPNFEVNVTTADGVMPCFIAQPDESGPHSPVILYMDVPGIREELHDFARRLAGDGFLCVLPDLYYRHGTVRFDLSKGASELQKMFAMGGQLTNAMVIRDTQGILDWLESKDDAQHDTGIVGYCMSGQFVISAAGTFPDRIKATAALYGTRMVTDQADSPHHLICDMRGEAYLGFAAHDPYVEDWVIEQMTPLLEANPALSFQLETHPETEHGFCFPQRPQYHEEHAESAWHTMIAMYKRALKS